MPADHRVARPSPARLVMAVFMPSRPPAGTRRRRGAEAGPDPGAAIEVRGLTRRFRSRTVLNGIDLTISRRARAGLWGPNGSGKTTLLRCLAGTLTPSAGWALVLGHAPGSRLARQATGVCLGQERAFYGRLSGRENLLFAARMRLRPEAAARAVAEVCDELGLVSFADQPVERCSSGMRARLAVGRALLGHPELVLLDEPTRSLDDRATELVQAALDRRPDVTVVIASPRREDLDWCSQVIDLAGTAMRRQPAGHRAPR
jgi:ABC-type multidrug transport system ATPase subunit